VLHVSPSVRSPQRTFSDARVLKRLSFLCSKDLGVEIVQRSCVPAERSQWSRLDLADTTRAGLWAHWLWWKPSFDVTAPGPSTTFQHVKRNTTKTNITRCVRVCVCMCVFARTCAYLCYGVYLLLSGPCVLLRMSCCSASCVVAECVPPFAVFCMYSFLSLSILCARPRALSVIMYRSYCICVVENMRAGHAHAHTYKRTPTRNGRCGNALIVRANTKISQPQRF